MFFAEDPDSPEESDWEIAESWLRGENFVASCIEKVPECHLADPLLLSYLEYKRNHGQSIQDS